MLNFNSMMKDLGKDNEIDTSSTSDNDCCSDELDELDE